MRHHKILFGIQNEILKNADCLVQDVTVIATICQIYFF